MNDQRAAGGAASKRSLISVGVGNINRSWTRAAALLVLLVLANAAGLHLGPGNLSRHLIQEAERTSTGSNIVIARSQSGLSAASCEFLNQSTSVQNAGWIRLDNDSAEIRPGINAPIASISAGMRTLLLVADPDLGGALIGPDLAERLLVAPDAANGTVYTPKGARTDQTNGWVLHNNPTVAAANECWIELAAESYDNGVDVTAAALLFGTPDLEIKPLLFDGGPKDFDANLLNIALAVSGLVAGLAGAMHIRTRRIELAMYRLLGFSKSDVAIIIGSEIATLLLAGATLALAGWLTMLALAGPVEQVVLLAVVSQLIGSTAIAAVIVAFTASLALRGSHQLTVLREGA